MIFIENVEKRKFNSFIEEHDLGHFLQTSEWGEFKSLHEWDMHRVGIEVDGKLEGCSLLLSRNVPIINKKILYAPRGFIIDYNNDYLLKEFIHNIKLYAKKIGAIFVRIDPYIKRLERDLEGDIVSGGENNEWIIEKLKNTGLVHKGFDLNFNGVQPRFAMRLDISKSIDKVLGSFHSKTRYNIRLAERKGIEIEEGSKDDLVRFEEIMRVTGERDGFITRPLSYFKEMYDVLVPTNRMKLFLAKYNIEKGMKNVREELEKENSNFLKLNKQFEESEDKEKKQKIEHKITICSDRIKRLEANLKSLEEEKKSQPDGLIISGTILMITGKKAWYLYGASDNLYRNLMPNYLIQWEMIKWAKERGCTLYDFRGISGDLSEENHLYGLYKFKKGFNPEFTEYIGEFDLIINKPLYFAWEIMLPKFKKIRRKILRR